MEYSMFFSGMLGAMLSALVTSMVALHVLKTQMRHFSNREYVAELISIIRRTYVAHQTDKPVDDEVLTSLTSFQIIGFKELASLSPSVDALKDSIIGYNKCRSDILRSTDTNHELLQAKKGLDTVVRSLTDAITKIT